MNLKFNLQFFGGLFGGGSPKITRYQKRYDEPEELKNLRLGLYDKISPGLESFNTDLWNKAQNITNNALDQQSSLMSQIPGQLNQSNNILGNIQNLLTTGELPSGITDKLNSGVTQQLNNSLGSMLNGLANRGVVNSSIMSQGVSRLGQQAAQAFNNNYLNAFNSVLSGQAQALQGSQGNLSSLLSALSQVGGMGSAAYQNAAAGLTPAYNFWKDWQNSYDNREDFDTVVQEGGSGFCLTGDTLVTINDGRNVPISELKDSDCIQCWDFDNGKLIYAPLTAFFKKHSDAPFKVIRLHFEDGSNVDVIFEHLFFDLNVGKFIPINMHHYNVIGHEFAKINQEGKIVPVKVNGISVRHDVFDAFSPHPKGHLNFFANGLLSATGGILGLCNMFDFDAQCMTYIQEKKLDDLARFGTLDYDTLSDVMSEPFFRENHFENLSVAFGKELISPDVLKAFFKRFNHCFLI